MPANPALHEDSSLKTAPKEGHHDPEESRARAQCGATQRVLYLGLLLVGGLNLGFNCNAPGTLPSIVDITNPAAPAELAQVKVGPDPVGVAVRPKLNSAELSFLVDLARHASRPTCRRKSGFPRSAAYGRDQARMTLTQYIDAAATVLVDGA